MTSILRTRALIGATALGTVAALVVGLESLTLHFRERFPYVASDSRQHAVWVTFACGVVSLAVAGGWLTYRLPRNPTGWWLSLAGLLLGVWLAVSFTPGPASPWAEYLIPPLVRVACIMAVLPWPLGRMEQRWSRTLRSAVAAYIGLALFLAFVGFHLPSWPNPRWRLPSAGGLTYGMWADAVGAVVVRGVAPALLLASLARRARQISVIVRDTVRPAFLGGVLLAVSELWIFAVDVLVRPQPMLSVRELALRGVQSTRWFVEFGRYTVIAWLFVVAEAVRRRRLNLSGSRSVEVGGAPVTDVNDVVAGLLRDESAVLIVGETAIEAPGRALLEFVDEHNRRLATIVHDPMAPISEYSAESVAAAVQLSVIRSTRERDLRARTDVVRGVQRDIVSAQDRARRVLERDLHDGVQQRLVALSLLASRIARAERTDSARASLLRTELIDAIQDAIGYTRGLFDGAIPAILHPGLAAGLTALYATLPLDASLQIAGDVPASNPVASALWYVASEAVANSLKHARATTISVSLQVFRDTVELSVSDNGVGGSSIPVSITERLDGHPAQLEVDSPRGGGTRVRVVVPITREVAQPCAD